MTSRLDTINWDFVTLRREYGGKAVEDVRGALRGLEPDSRMLKRIESRARLHSHGAHASIHSTAVWRLLNYTNIGEFLAEWGAITSRARTEVQLDAQCLNSVAWVRRDVARHGYAFFSQQLAGSDARLEIDDQDQSVRHALADLRRLHLGVSESHEIASTCAWLRSSKRMPGNEQVLLEVEMGPKAWRAAAVKTTWGAKGTARGYSPVERFRERLYPGKFIWPALLPGLLELFESAADVLECARQLKPEFAERMTESAALLFMPWFGLFDAERRHELDPILAVLTQTGVVSEALSYEIPRFFEILGAEKLYA